MTKQTEAMKAALTALKSIDEAMPFPVAKFAIRQLEEALAEQPAQQEHFDHKAAANAALRDAQNRSYQVAKSTQPAQQRPQNCGTGYCSCIECLFEPEHQEPVAYAVYHRMGGSKSLHWPEQHSPDGDANQYQLVPLYTSPPASKPWVRLTDEEMQACWNDTMATPEYSREGIYRAIEAKLKEKNSD